MHCHVLGCILILVYCRFVLDLFFYWICIGFVCVGFVLGLYRVCIGFLSGFYRAMEKTRPDNHVFRVSTITENHEEPRAPDNLGADNQGAARQTVT